MNLTIDEQGDGKPTLLLHGGAGPQSVAGFARLLAGRARVITPTHPGFGGTERPDWLTTVAGLADVYARLLDERDLREVAVIGNSIGGWIAAELALRSPRVGNLVLVNAVGIVVDGEPIADVSQLSMDELAKLSYHDPEKFRVDPESLSPEQKLGMAANRAALAVYGNGTAMTDPTLKERLAGITQPTLVVWGESDGIVTPGYGRALAAAIPGARFQLLTGAGHVPQIEAPERLLEAIAT
ncbi:Pimeloyl-ACP methyl ester carboxylesterase [Amycolatopsis xylanica]|uniref:Pimeloyl-ACP methyl ester carboxylesterase n=1 Tax=Amycolatopsis xylanica TaxID=589385 RepID=A0A1H3CNP4_9PSEU|nr:alpha/beta hydrolase [Amycolatopsis xylanica]SDX55773.1 Pimeloyl-ACP methyl ester carboxylesterase [Amycolatopsis xylanica]